MLHWGQLSCLPVPQAVKYDGSSSRGSSEPTAPHPPTSMQSQIQQDISWQLKLILYSSSLLLLAQHWWRCFAIALIWPCYLTVFDSVQCSAVQCSGHRIWYKQFYGASHRFWCALHWQDARDDGIESFRWTNFSFLNTRHTHRHKERIQFKGMRWKKRYNKELYTLVSVGTGVFRFWLHTSNERTDGRTL